MRQMAVETGPCFRKPRFEGNFNFSVHSPESMIECFVLPRIKNSKVMGVGDKDAPEEPGRQYPIAR
jgi:hypothetical protein